MTSLRVGIAIDRKLIKAVDTPLFDYFPEYADLRTPERDGILLRHLLTVSARLELDQDRPRTDARNSETRMFQSLDPYGFTLESALVTPQTSEELVTLGASFVTAVAVPSWQVW